MKKITDKDKEQVVHFLLNAVRWEVSIMEAYDEVDGNEKVMAACRKEIEKIKRLMAKFAIRSEGREKRWKR